VSQSLASRGSRLGAVLLDNLAVVVALLPGGLALVAAADSYGNDGMGGALALLVVGFVGVLGIQIYLLVQQGQTIGKRAVGLRIVGYNSGSLLGAGRILGMRTLAPGFIAGIPYVGWVFALADVLFIFGEERRCIHDYMARSKVVTGDAVEGTTADVADTSRAAQNEASGPSSLSPPASDRSAGDSGRTEGPSADPTRSDPSPAVPPSIDRLRQVLQNLEELRDEGTITEEKFQQSRRKALADVVEQVDADDDALLDGLRRLRDEGHLEDTDVQTVKSIL